ncbi:TPA: 50S ribosomal protein L6 [Candidatus Campbellbacteria bacterium]|uniref:Large ribosomal subunit protein uL6 n=2 Tax=Candidatus Campbelliibacteriota TaxID=1752727 RepID=A0A1F5EQB2_9BACT|nr:MAG: 50S ribosomal protein L6, large subunit ribosomal protein L6 [Candidatus Campbellbacteria bacterium GW2011_OD1_34_28]KKP75153.1 MAG: 50S ribosomal protein L6 [Candidatus Campbellbacteria bacterium GW2011_GWD2_35_24]KKP76286.1 MAG: LSU ribosomal protein L6P [Candidatus Campbellbacteria bacterium GW2011_GWC2_35_28]KKP77475.1 MAG: 50S ribosomal protein L6 [Candidatus Campbellbacteria bacterium GW2011_GWC1_35_31]KKP79404.1 MAG: 50S ribosomal protein L6 [Candidatus Campbellbacteria bacterium
MSRIGKREISIPEKTEVIIDGNKVTVKGPLGELTREIRSEIKIKIENGIITMTPIDETVFVRSLWGTTSSHISNMIDGVNKPFEKKLIVEGVGFRADAKGKDLVMNLGFSHEVIIPIPADLTVTTEKNTITISGIDKERVGKFSADVRSNKKPEPYKGKGIRYSDEVVRRKQGKKTA